MPRDSAAGARLARNDERFLRVARAIDDASWRAPSLCAEWTNHEVLAHLVIGYSAPTTAVLGRVLRSRGRFDPANTAMATELAARRGPRELLDDLDGLRKSPRGIGRIFPKRLLLGDHVVHELDIVFALDLAPAIPVDTLTAVLDTQLAAPNPFVPAFATARGLHLSATDVAWERRARAADARTVIGSAADLASVLAGRPHAAHRLHGDGAALLRGRVAGAR